MSIVEMIKMLLTHSSTSEQEEKQVVRGSCQTLCVTKRSKEEKMYFKRVNCPVCGQKVSNFWFYFWIPNTKHTCPNCKTRIKWHPIIRLHGLVFGIIMMGGYYLLKDFFEPPYIAFIISTLVGIIVYILIPKKVKIISKGEEKNI